MQRIILPIVYEDNNPAKIRAAFKAGCGGVIVDGHLPDSVTVELDRFAANLERQRWLAGESMALDVDAQAHRTWSRDVPELYETCRWLEEEFAALSARKLTPATPHEGHRHLMSIWSGESTTQPWHIDRKPSQIIYPDTHIHLYGAGLVMAVPPRPLSLLFSDAQGTSPRLQIPGSAYMVESDEELDGHLQDRGCTFIALQPGQRVYFGENCLHKSSFTFPPAFKMRAAIF